MINFFLKIIVQPLKSLTLISSNYRFTEEDVDYLVEIIQDLERQLDIENQLKVSIKLHSSCYNHYVLDFLNKLGNKDKELILFDDSITKIFVNIPDIKDVVLNSQN